MNNRDLALEEQMSEAMLSICTDEPNTTILACADCEEDTEHFYLGKGERQCLKCWKIHKGKKIQGA